MKLVVLFLSAIALSACGPVSSPGEETTRYVCRCGPECDCKTVSDQPGKCACGEYLIPE